MKYACSGLSALIAAFALFALSAPAIANTGPSTSELFLHVQPDSWPPPPPLTSCSQIIQHTDATGWLEFDVYQAVTHWYGAFAIGSIDIAFEVPGSWQLSSEYIVPAGGTGTMSWVNGHPTYSLSWPDCQPYATEIQLLLRIYLNVDGPGALQPLTGWPLAELCIPWTGPTWGDSYGASAGDPCGYRQESCSPGMHCWPEAATPQLALQAVQGAQLQETLNFTLQPDYIGACSASCQSTAPWMAVAGKLLEDEHNYEVSLDIDTATLAPGTHSAWVQVDSGFSRACTEVILEVLTATGVQSLDAGVSWGDIKSLY